VDGAREAEPPLELGACVPLGEGVTGALVPPVDGLATPGVADALLEGLDPPFFMPIIRNRPTTRSRTPMTPIWTLGCC
jgi:hypothetical protein